MQRSFLGQVMTSRPCPQCQGFGTVIPHPCPECNGDGRVRTRRTLTVKIPPGVDDGTRIQLAGEGEVGPGGGPAGDLYVEIVAAAARRSSSASGDDLHCTVAAADDRGRARHGPDAGDPRRAEDVDIRPGTQSGHVVTLKARGVAAPARRRPRRPAASTSTSQTPTKLDAEQEELLRELATLRGEETVEHARFTRPEKEGLFSRIKDAFSAK